MDVGEQPARRWKTVTALAVLLGVMLIWGRRDLPPRPSFIVLPPSLSQSGQSGADIYGLVFGKGR